MAEDIGALLNELDAEAEPKVAWKREKATIQRGTSATAKYTSTVPTANVRSTIESYAADFYGAIGEGGSSDRAIQAQRFQTDLGDNYGPFREAIKDGDRDTANKLVRDSFENRASGAKIAGIVERISDQSPDARLAFGRSAAAKAGGDDYMAATNPGAVVQVLSAQKRAAEGLRYK